MAHATATARAIAAATAMTARAEAKRAAVAEARAWATAITQAHARATAITQAHARVTAAAQAHARATAAAQAHARATAAAQAHARATAAARAAATVVVQKTATARAQATASAVAQAHAQATLQAVVQAHAQQTSQAAADATAAVQPSGDTYADVNDHPDLHQGEYIQWTCNIAKFLGDDPNVVGNTDIGCWEYTGVFNGTGDGEIILNVPASIDTSTMHSGDDLRVYGRVDQPWQGQNEFGATMTWPQIDAKSLTDLGHDSNAGS